VDREVAMHGVSVVEVWKQSGGAFSVTGTWAVNAASTYNRRITAGTPIEISGPGRDHPSMVTKYSPLGRRTRGTLNNCGTGYSFWGTLLTCEENWAGYFLRPSTDNANRSAKDVASLTRYQVGGDRYRWGTLAATTAAGMAANAVDSVADNNDRWNASVMVGATADQDYRNVANTFGWVVEIDPHDRNAVPKKRTALGRFAHEAAVGNAPVAGQKLAFYMGDDSRGDYIYKFVSSASWDPADAYPANRMAIGDKYLDSGTLYVARFNADGTGTWLPLTLAAVQAAQAASGTVNYAFADQFDVLLNARLAGDALGATRMDRPEWGAVNPDTKEIYFTLTENNNSALAANGQSGRRADNIDAANPRFYADARGATNTTTTGTNTGNPFGHIIRFRENGLDPAATAFTWDVFLFGAQADADPARVNLSGLTTANDFARADGLWFSATTGLCWIQTDDSGAFLDQSNCMMLAAVAGRVGDGQALSAQAASAAAVGSTPAGAQLAATRVGRAMSETTMRRFLVGPRDQEITGVTETPDGRTMFVNVQHPGEDTPASAITAGLGDFNSYWPGGERAPGSAASATGPRPRSATVVIIKNDGGLIGS
jgi:secreted PhoX family phosphatase